MNIEKQGRKPTEKEVRVVEEKLIVFISEHPEIAKIGLSEAETRLASELMTGRLILSGKNAEDVDDEMLLRAIEARRSVRGSGKNPVWDSQGVVIGTAGSQNEAKEMVRRENEARDLG
jgi:hypothetical protein